MIKIRPVRNDEMDSTKRFIAKIFPQAMVQVCDDDLLLVAENNGKYIGFAHVIEDDERILLQGIGVDQSVRGEGVGTMLLDHVASMLQDSPKPVYLQVNALNPAIHLYERYGFMLKKFGDIHLLVKMPDN
ncbi:GNAT family N-acetyltransferase [Candidatus Micrarchaeota archaeon]|nr:GNAT family N-acetyltransferase [Candidatus Micrarchaeota archaeon]